MKPLTEAVKDKLFRAIEKSAVLVNGGDHPNEAIAKAATDTGVPARYIDLMVRAYNTGRTTRQREEGKTALEKAADFELADTAAILELMYPSQVKSAADERHETEISLDYALPPTGMLQRREAEEKRAAAQNINWRRWSRGEGEFYEEFDVPEAGPLPEDPMLVMKRAYCDSERLQRRVDEARRKVAHARDKMATTFMEITDYFHRTDATPIPIVREQASLLHGGKARQLIDEVVKVTPSLMKLSNHKHPRPSRTLESVDGEVYGLVSQFLDELDEYKQLKAAHDSLHKSALQEMKTKLDPFAIASRSVLDDPIFSTDSDEDTDTGQIKASFSPMNVLGQIALVKTVLNPSPGAVQNKVQKQESAVNSAFDKLTDPAHESALRNIQTSATLQDLMLNDPTISSYDPQEAIDAFNDVATAAPSLVDKRLALQALMRKRLEQGALDPHDVDQLLKMERTQQQNIQPLAGGPSNYGS